GARRFGAGAGPAPRRGSRRHEPILRLAPPRREPRGRASAPQARVDARRGPALRRLHRALARRAPTVAALRSSAADLGADPAGARPGERGRAGAAALLPARPAAAARRRRSLAAPG